MFSEKRDVEKGPGSIVESLVHVPVCRRAHVGQRAPGSSREGQGRARSVWSEIRLRPARPFPIIPVSGHGADSLPGRIRKRGAVKATALREACSKKKGPGEFEAPKESAGACGSGNSARTTTVRSRSEGRLDLDQSVATLWSLPRFQARTSVSRPVRQRSSQQPTSLHAISKPRG